MRGGVPPVCGASHCSSACQRGPQSHSGDEGESHHPQGPRRSGQLLGGGPLTCAWFQGVMALLLGDLETVLGDPTQPWQNPLNPANPGWQGRGTREEYFIQVSQFGAISEWLGPPPRRGEWLRGRPGLCELWVSSKMPQCLYSLRSSPKCQK